MAGEGLLSSTWYSEIGLPSPREEPGCCFSARNLRRKVSYSWSRLLEFVASLVEMGRLDPRKIAFAAKMAIALAIVSVLTMIGKPFRDFGIHSIWALLTVVVMFEYSVGIVKFGYWSTGNIRSTSIARILPSNIFHSRPFDVVRSCIYEVLPLTVRPVLTFLGFLFGETLRKGLYRVVVAVLAGGLALSAAALCSLAGGWEKVAIATIITIAGFCTTYLRLYSGTRTAYAFQVFLLVYCSILVSGYQTGQFIHVGFTVFLVTALSAAICLVTNAFIFPSWAGDSLRELVTKNLITIADSLEGCVDGYLSQEGYMRIPLEILTYQELDDPLYNGYRSVLESTSREASLVNSATCEPSFCGYRMLRYPWKTHARLSGALRHCALMVTALHGCVMSDMQASSMMKQKFSEEFQSVATEGARVLRVLADKLERMEKLKSTRILEEANVAAEALHIKINQGSEFLARVRQPRDIFSMEEEDRSDLTSLATFAFLLVEFVMRLGLVVDSFHELSEEANYMEPVEQYSDIEADGNLCRSHCCLCF